MWPAETSHLAPPSQELFEKSTIERYILHSGGTCISTVLYCVVIHMRSKVCSLCVDCYISGILWNSVARVCFGNAIFSWLYFFFSTISSLSMFNSLLLILSLSFHFSIPTGFQLLHTVFPGSNRKKGLGGERQLIITKKEKRKPKTEHTTYNRENQIELLNVTDLISVCKNFQGNGHFSTRAELRKKRSSVH